MENKDAAKSPEPTETELVSMTLQWLADSIDEVLKISPALLAHASVREYGYTHGFNSIMRRKLARIEMKMRDVESVATRTRK